VKNRNSFILIAIILMIISSLFAVDYLYTDRMGYVGDEKVIILPDDISIAIYADTTIYEFILSDSIFAAYDDSLAAHRVIINVNSDSLDALGLLVLANTPSLQSTTLGVGAVTLASTSNIITLTGDGSANVLATITGAEIGLYTIQFVDGLITITDDDTHGADSIDLTGTAADLTSADDLILQLLYDGISFYQIGSSAN